MTPQPQSETELIERANRGEEEALAEIYRRHGGWVLSLASRFTSSRDEAHDVLQDVFTYFLRQFPGFRLSSTLRAYLYPVVKHVAISRARKSSRVVSLVEWKDDAGQRPGWEPPDTDLGRLVAGLSPRQREVVQLRFVLGMKLGEIAAALGLPLGTVKSRLHGALAALRELHGVGRPEEKAETE